MLRVRSDESFIEYSPQLAAGTMKWRRASHGLREKFLIYLFAGLIS